MEISTKDLLISWLYCELKRVTEGGKMSSFKSQRTNRTLPCKRILVKESCSLDGKKYRK